MDTTKHNFIKLLLIFIIIIGIGSLVYYNVINYDMKVHTVEGQIIDIKETAFIESMNDFKDLYMIKYEKNGEYYIDLKFNKDLPSKLKCSKKEYDKMVSGKYYYINFKCKGEDYKNAEFTEVFDNNPNM